MFIEFATFVAVTLACVIYGIGLPRLVQRAVGDRSTDETRDLAASVGFRVSVLYSLIIGILLASLVADYTEAVRQVLAEGVEILRADEALQQLDSGESQIARQALKAYAESAVGDEWNQIGAGLPSPSTRSLLMRLQSAVAQVRVEGAFESDMQARAREHVSRLTEFRAHRFLSSANQEVYAFWLLGAVGFTALLIPFGFYSTSRTGSFIIGVFSVMQATVFYVALVASDPFREPGAISPKPLQRSIALITMDQIESLDKTRPLSD